MRRALRVRRDRRRRGSRVDGLRVDEHDGHPARRVRHCHRHAGCGGDRMPTVPGAVGRSAAVAADLERRSAQE